MSKIFKRLLGLVAVGGAVAAGVIYYLNNSENNDDFLDEFDDDFDLDDDLNPAAEREYVSLNTAPQADTDEPEAEKKEAADETDNAGPAAETGTEKDDQAEDSSR